MSLNKPLMIKALSDILTMIKTQDVMPNTGFCYFLNQYEEFNGKVHDLLEPYYSTSEYYSGNKFYPVAVPYTYLSSLNDKAYLFFNEQVKKYVDKYNVPADAANAACMYVWTHACYWKGSYGNNRVLLIEHIIARLKSEYLADIAKEKTIIQNFINYVIMEDKSDSKLCKPLSEHLEDYYDFNN
ncbi:hypothetical protein KNT64_gp189 [Pseudomonas phage PspYZU05]|uniref:Uncharacterized protein n=1 Tax=Pseudomonas phage PspYZU05 TaxID=1983556 RepID=A0A2U7NF74_9CAUD|nr:hypothetical protein KNT64_gp189 [Pseudomonas phage PspYZU05]ASD52141.1 hypothetical protein PspYZU05_189 [Pseudomonas phage PspYZU05]